MPHRNRRLSPSAYEALQVQMATATALCSDDQVLDLADALHDALRRRRRTEFDHAHGHTVEGAAPTFIAMN